MGNFCNGNRGLQYNSNNVITLNVNNSENKKISFPIHHGSIWDVSCLDNAILTASEDCRVGLNAVLPNHHLDGNPIYFEGHRKAVNRIVQSNNKLWSASRDLSVKQVTADNIFWNANDFLLEYSL
jgi:hypothetical protein